MALRYGSRGSSVTELQNSLKGAGFNPGPIDGIFGPRTQAALRAYQEANDLPVTGVYDTATSAKLDAPEGGDTSGGAGSGGESGEGGEATLPKDARNLVIVPDAAGADGKGFYVTSTWRGVTFAYFIGGEDRMKELFGDNYTAAFESSQTMNQARMDAQDWVTAPSMTVDAILGDDESLASQMEREVRAAKGEDLPAWVLGDPGALRVMAQGMAQGWSPGRTWQELEKTEGFAERFPAWDRYKGQNMTVVDAKEQYLADESALRASLRQYGDPSRLTTDYLGRVMAKGWDARTATTVMDAAMAMRSQPEGMATANLILRARGVKDAQGRLITLDEKSFMNIMSGYGEESAIEALNEAAAASALKQAGLEDVDLNLVMSVVDDITSIRSTEDFSALAQQLSTQIITNARDLDFARYGLSEEDLVASAFGRESPSGKSTGEVLSTLAKVERERRNRSTYQGTQTQGYIDPTGRLRQAGTSGM